MGGPGDGWTPYFGNAGIMGSNYPAMNQSVIPRIPQMQQGQPMHTMMGNYSPGPGQPGGGFRGYNPQGLGMMRSGMQAPTSMPQNMDMRVPRQPGQMVTSDPWNQKNTQPAIGAAQAMHMPTQNGIGMDMPRNQGVSPGIDYPSAVQQNTDAQRNKLGAALGNAGQSALAGYQF